jgi:hypothetical protein
MKKEDGLIEEFKGLKSELISISNIRIWGTFTYVAIVAGISSSNLENFGLRNEFQVIKYIFFIFISLPLILHTSNRERARVRIANYIRKVIEPNVPGLYWESYLDTWRSSEEIIKSGTKDRWIHIFSLTGIYAIIVVFSIIMSILWFIKTNKLSITITFIGIFGIIGTTLFVLSIFYMNRIIKNSNKDQKLLEAAEKKIREQK